MKKMVRSFLSMPAATKFGICLGILGAILCFGGLAVMGAELFLIHPMNREYLQYGFYFGFIGGMGLMACGMFGCAIDVLVP